METTTPALDALLAERDIFGLVARFDDAATTNDLEAFSALWTEDASWEIGAPVNLRAHGVHDIVVTLAEMQTRNEFFFRLSGRPTVVIDADTARLRCPTVEVAGRGHHRDYVNVALYEDDVVRRSGLWRFQRRRYRYLWADLQATLGGRVEPLTPRDDPVGDDAAAS
jgi:hypothetical protein